MSVPRVATDLEPELGEVTIAVREGDNTHDRYALFSLRQRLPQVVIPWVVCFLAHCC